MIQEATMKHDLKATSLKLLTILLGTSTLMTLNMSHETKKNVSLKKGRCNTSITIASGETHRSWKGHCFNLIEN
jgi:redox-regulated HSP33 family molecular chaperone